jgi:NAD(P)-dependent dehydrogenase (short-subunit alcohol dehydrogenase family)
MRDDGDMALQSLDGRVVAIAGVGGGLGPVVAERLAAAGAVVCGCDREQAHVDSVAEALGLDTPQWDGRAVDLLDEGATQDWCDALLERFGRVDALLHLVGGWRGGQPLHEAPLSDWALLHDLLIRTVQHTTRAFHDALLASGHGRFVLVSAKQAQSPSDSNAAYAAAKAAAEAWTLALADGFEGGDATANIVVVEAILTAAMRERDPEGDFAAFTPAEHIAEAIVFLCSDAAEKMNGQRLRLTMG